MGPREPVPVAPLVAATAPLEYRLVEARLTGGFAWAEFRGPVRSSTEARNSPARLKLSGAAGEVLERAGRDGSARTQHAAAVASLLIEDPADAIGRLKKVLDAHPDDANAWSDLAAARLEVARFDHDAELPQALADADHALRINPQHAEALFNRAVIVEKLGLVEEARRAWKKYLDFDGTTDWAREARTRLNELPATTDQQSLFRKILPQLERDVDAGDTVAVARSVDLFPQQSRAYMEVEMLGQWAESFRRGDVAAARHQLSVARAVGAALVARKGEGLLADCVAAIDEANDAKRVRLAEAHAVYRTGRIAMSTSDISTARRDLQRAIELFANASTAGWLNARYYLVVADYVVARIETSERELRDLLARTARLPQYKALRASIAWQYGLAQGTMGRLPESIGNLQLAHDLFASLGERGNAAYMSALIGETMMMTGRRDEAWSHWAEAFHTLSEVGPPRYFANTLIAAEQSELLAGHLHRANSLLDIESRDGSRDGRPRALILFRRAIVSTRLGDHNAAAAALSEGMEVANKIPDRNVRAGVVADLAVAEGITFASAEPERALVSLTNATSYYRHSRQSLLPPTLFERARLLKNLGRTDEALLDLQSAVETLEMQRENVDSRDLRSLALDGIDQIYILLAELLLERNKPREAFVIVDRAAAHSFYGARATAALLSLDDVQRRLAPGEVILEYFVRPDEIVTFLVGSDRFFVQRTPVTSADVSARAMKLDTALRDRAPGEAVRVAAAALYEILIAPVRTELANAQSITIVPDPVLASVPYAALLDQHTNRWLIEDYTLSVAASALYREKIPAPRPNAQHVAVIRPSVGQIDLPSAEAEAAAIMRLYPRSTLLQGRDASPGNVIDAISVANVIHYAGHTDSERDSGLVLRVENGEPELLYGADITRMQLSAAPLVILAGCKTLRGGRGRDDLGASVSRAFLLAGASAVIGTSWDVDDDAAARLFIRFHELRAAGVHPVPALRDAQLALLHDPRLHAADWASAQIVVRSLDI